MNKKKCQQGLLAWFKLNPADLKPLSSIETICLNLFRQSHPETAPDSSLRRSVYSNIFYPLLRLGVIEFYGDNCYGLSPSAILQSDTKILFSHVPDAGELSLEEQLAIYKNSGVEVYNLSSICPGRLLQLKNLIQSFSLSDIFHSMLAFEKVIGSWPDSVTFELSGCLFLNEKLVWENPGKEFKNGIYKKSDKAYAQRILKVNDSSWKYIPARIFHPDAFNLAIVWTQSKEALNLGYSRTKKLLRLRNSPFPFVLERLLVINSLLSGSEEYNIDNREYYLSLENIEELNTLIGNKISFYE